MIELFGKLSLGIPIVVITLLCVFWIVGGFDEKVETPDVPDIPTIPDDIPDVPTIPTEPNCIDKLYVTVYRHDLRTGEYDWLMYEGEMKCHNIQAYKESPDFVVVYENGYRGSEIKIQTTWDADTNGWQGNNA